MASRRTKRADGRYLVTLTVENPDGPTRRVYFDGRTQAGSQRSFSDQFWEPVDTARGYAQAAITAHPRHQEHP